MRASPTKASPAKPRQTLGRQTYGAVRALIRGGAKPTHAIRSVAEQTGRSVAAVSTTYYAVARELPNGGGVKRTKGRRSQAGGRPMRQPGRSETPTRATAIDRLVQELQTAAAGLQAHIEHLERENAEYRAITEKLTRLAHG